jgi:hypothetical protein
MTSTVESPSVRSRVVPLVPGSMVPDPSVLPDVLPTDRLNERAKPTQPLRGELRHFSERPQRDHRRRCAASSRSAS